MSDINTTTISGRLVRDPVMRTAATGMQMAYLTIAANHRYRDKGGNPQESTAFVACKIFGGWVNALSECHKGDTLVISGYLRTESWEKDARRETQLVLVSEAIYVISRAQNTKSGPPQPRSAELEMPMPTEVKNAVPF